MLEVRDLHVNYGAISALHGISLDVKQGEIVTLIGANGAGKSTTLRTISGLVKPRSGMINFETHSIAGLPPHVIVGRGIAQSPEGRMVFANLTVIENLRMGAYRRNDHANFGKDFDYVFSIFPRLKERMQQTAGTLSGGEQQMLALARALVARPRLLMLDEPSLGLAPTIVTELFRIVTELNAEEGLTVLVVEQNANIALDASARAYVLEVGKVAVSGTSDELRRHEGVRKSYLGY